MSKTSHELQKLNLKGDVSHSMDWRDHIHSVPGILSGKPVIRGTRISVEFILRLLAQGWTEEQILENYESITPEALRSIFAYAAEGVTEDKVYQFD